MEAADKRLDTQVAETAAELANKLLAPIDQTLRELDAVLPGVGERLAGAIDKERIVEIFSAAAAENIKGLIEQGTETSLQAALAKLEELRGKLDGKQDLNSPEAERTALLKEFGIEVLGEEKVRVVLNGASRIDFLRRAGAAASEIHGRPAIYEPRLEQWSKDAAYTEKISKEFSADGNVKGSTNKTRSEQEQKGWNNVDLKDLAVAHTAYFLATGKDLFGGNFVRARGGALFFNDLGLDVDDCYDGPRYAGVAACAALPARNPVSP